MPCSLSDQLWKKNAHFLRMVHPIKQSFGSKILNSVNKLQRNRNTCTPVFLQKSKIHHAEENDSRSRVVRNPLSHSKEESFKFRRGAWLSSPTFFVVFPVPPTKTVQCPIHCIAVHCLLIVPTFDTMQPALLTAPLNRPHTNQTATPR